MASRYEIVDYIRSEHPTVASQLGDDESIYEWARNKYLHNYPSWKELDKPFNVENADTGTFRKPENQIQLSPLQKEDSSPERFGWLERFLEYGGIAEEALGKGAMKEMNVIRMVSQGMGIDDNYWEQAYNNSEAGLIYNMYTGEDKYTVEDFHEGGAKGALIDASSFVVGLVNPVGLGLFAVSGGASKAGSAIAGTAIKRHFINKGMQHSAKALAGNRPFLRSMISQGVSSSAGLGTFFAAHGAMGEAALQSKAIKQGTMDNFDYGEIIKKTVEHGKEGLIIGGAIGIGIGGSMGTRYGQLMLKSKAEGKNLTRFENIQKALTHPIPRLGAEGAMFQLSGDIYGKTVRGEAMTPIFSPEWWEEYIHSTAVIGGIKMGHKVWGKVLGKPPSEYGEDADRIMMEGLKDARDFSKGMDKSLKNVKDDIGDVSPAVSDALDKKLISEEIKLGRSEAEYKVIRADIKEMQSLMSEFNEKGAAIGHLKMKRLSELSFEHNSMLTAVLSDMKNNPEKAYDIISKITGKGALSEAEKKRAINYVEKTLKTLEAASILANAPVTGGMNIPKEGIDTGIKADEIPVDGTTNTNVNSKGNIVIYGAHTKIPKGIGGKPTKPVTISSVEETLKNIAVKLEDISKEPVLEETPNYKEQLTKSTNTLSLAGADIQKRSKAQRGFMEQFGREKIKPIVEKADEITKTSFVNWGVNEHAKRREISTANQYIISVSDFVDFISKKKIPIHKMEPGELTEYFYENKIKETDNSVIQGIRHYLRFLNDNDYIKGNKYREYDDVMAGFTSIYNEYVATGKNPPRVGIRSKVIDIGKDLSKLKGDELFNLSAKLGAKYGLRREEIRALNTEYKKDKRLIKRTDDGDYYIDLPAIKAKSFAREVWIDSDLASSLSAHLETGKQISTAEIGKKMRPFSDNEKHPFLDLRRRISKVGNNVLSGDEYRALNYMLGHDKTRIEKIYVLDTVEESIAKQKTIQSKLGIGKEAPTKKRFLPIRPKEEIIFKTKSERDLALQNFMARNKMTPESLKEAKLGKNEMGEFMDGAVKLAKGEWQPIDFFHENAHRLKYYAESNNNKKLLKMFSQGEKLIEGSKEYEAWLKKNPNVKNPVEEFFTDVIAGKGVAKEYNKGFVNKIKQWAKNLVSAFKVAFNKGDYKDIASVLAGKVQKGFAVKGGLKTGERKLRIVDGVDISEAKEYVKAIKARLNKMIEQYKPGVQDKAEVINIIAEDAGLKDFKLSSKASMEDLETFYNHFTKNVPVKDIPKKVNIATWFRNYRTAESSRLRANVSKEAQKEWLETLGVSEGNIFRASVEQLKSYQAILHTMKYEKHSDIDWIDSKLMSDNIDPEVRNKFIKYGGLKQGMYPVHLVFEGMGLKKLSRKMVEHAAIEQGHIGTWIRFENDAKKIIGNNFINKRWNKYRDFIYLFDRKRYIERKDAGKLSNAEKTFINKATTKEWQDGTNKSVKDMFTNTREGKLGKLYTEFTKSYKDMFHDILSLHLNEAELRKWKDDNYVRWVEDNVYVSRQITDKFKKLYPSKGNKYKKFVESQATILAEKEVVKRFGKKYTTEQYAETFDWATGVAWAELSDMFSFGGQKYSSKFLEKRHIKLPEFVEINGKQVQVYETKYERTVQPYATGMAKLFANFEVFPEFTKVKGFKVSDAKEVIGKLEAIHPKHGKWVKEQLDKRLGLGDSPTGDIANNFVKGTSKFASLLSKMGLSFPTAALKNILVGNTQTVLAFKITDFTRGMWDAMARDKRMSVKSTGATELGMRHLQEMQTFKGVNWLSNKLFSFGGMKPTENINRYVSVLAGRHDQARGVEILQRHNVDSKKYKRVAERFKDFYHITGREISLLKKYGMNGLEDVTFKSSVEKAKTGRELDRIYQKMDSMAHINTQGASIDVFMPYWWNKGYVRPFTLYKRMAYAATFNTAANLKDAWKGRNFMKLAAFGFATYYSGEALMAAQNNYLGTPFPTKDEDGVGRLGLTLWKAEFGGLLSEFMKILYGDDQIGFQIYPAIGTAVDNMWYTFTDVKNIWFDMEGVAPAIKMQLTHASGEDYLSKSLSLYGNMKKLILNRKSKYNTEYRQAAAYAKEFGRESGLESTSGFARHSNSNYWDLFENAWNRSYMTGNKEEFYRVFWLTYWGIATNYHRRGSQEDGIPIRTQGQAMKEAGKQIMNHVKAFNPNRYTYSRKSKMGKMKALKYQLWLGEGKLNSKKYLDILKLEAQFSRNYRIFKDKDLYDSMSMFHMLDMKKYFK